MGARKSKLQAGDPVPVVQFKDLDGNKGTNSDIGDGIAVYSFADRKSSKKLMDWMENAQMKVIKKHPKLKITYFSFADLAAAPARLSHLVNPILKKVNDYAMKKMRKSYEAQGIDFRSLQTRFFMIPDWTGDFLQAFGLRDARDFQTFIAAGDKIVAVLDPSTPGVGEKFFQVLDGLAQAKDAK